MYQKITIIGNLGRDPEMRYMPDGTAVTSFSVATSRRWTDGRTGQQQDETAWFRVSVWRKQAETANQYLSKGKRVLVEGRLKVDAQTGGPAIFTRQDGTVGASFEIIAENILFLTPKGESGGDYESGGSGGSAAHEEDEIPF